MTETWNDVFSGSVSLERVHPAGIALMAAAVALLFAAKPISKRWPEDRRLNIVNVVKLAALLICCVGAAISILG